MRLSVLGAILVCGLGGAACAHFGVGAGEARSDGARVERGRAFVEAQCASCHAVGPTGASPFAAAPPFRTLHERYAVTDLEEALAEGITVGHPAMPEFQLEPEQIRDVVAYLQSLEKPAR